MTESAKEIFEKYEVRKTWKQKTDFIDYIKSKAEKEGYTAKTQGNKKVRNIVIGDPERANVVYTAHYDTCPGLPFPNFITPKNIFIYILYQLLLSVFLIGIPMLLGIGIGRLAGSLGAEDVLVGTVTEIVYFASLFALLYLIMKGPANPHTANDNTSGVITLISIMESLPEELRGSVAFIFFDLEEVGLVGSSMYYSKHKSAMQNKLLLNFDCVSDGKTMLFAVNKKAKKYIPEIESAFPKTEEFTPDIASKGVFYPSDQARFPLGVGVAALKKTKRGLLYMDRIHTAKDTVFEEENIEYLSDGAIALAELIKNKAESGEVL